METSYILELAHCRVISDTFGVGLIRGGPTNDLIKGLESIRGILGDLFKRRGQMQGFTVSCKV